MTDAERREAARQFCQRWAGRGREDEDARSYWIEFLQNIIGMENVTERVDFEKKVIGPDGNTKRIDVYIPETFVLIEQKSYGIALDKPQQGHNGMTPYEQAKMYDNSLPRSEKAKWIIVSNFAEIWVYDLEERKPEPQKFALSDIQTKYSLFEFLINKKQQKISQEMEVSIEAGKFVGLLYDALLKEYIDPENEESLKSLNMLCVRLVFCLYAEDAHIFGSNGHMFHDYMDQFETKDMRKALIELFKTLDIPEEKRDKYDTSDLSKFPYVNGGLFADENIEIPNFTDEIREVLLEKASAGFDWSQISPTIFGAVFESTLNPETRRSGGMHYTSIENIHKVIDPLFLDDLKAELEEILSLQVERTKKAKLEAFQDKLASLRWLDPACGSGNFLTETYISIRRIENRVIRAILDCDKSQIDGQIVLGEAINPIKVGINAFYGIEINDFAVTVAKTALWIAESQMIKETEDIVHMSINFLPLSTNAYIYEGNALRINWEDIIPVNKINYIMGNPPFVGQQKKNENMTQDKALVFGKGTPETKLDYVICWYKKALDYINTYPQKGHILGAFVSTNSICQGESVPTFWKRMHDDGIEICFAYRSFQWISESKNSATVMCTIVGFTNGGYSKQKYIYDNGNIIKASRINAYLQDAPDIWITSRSNNPPEGFPKMIKGSEPTDGGYLFLTSDERADFIKKYPVTEAYIKPFVGGDEYLNDKDGIYSRYVFWFKDGGAVECAKIKEIRDRFEAIKEKRLTSTADRIQKRANVPYLFCQIRQPETEYLLFPRHSSGERRYIPIGFMSADVIVGDACYIIPDSSLYLFGLLTSNVHMAWVRLVCGRLGNGYRYSPAIYNNFPFPTPTNEQKEKIEETAKMILNARNNNKNSNLSGLYDPLFMPPELQKAHTANDRAVMQAYGFDIKNMSEADCVSALMKMYQKLTK